MSLRKSNSRDPKKIKVRTTTNSLGQVSRLSTAPIKRFCVRAAWLERWHTSWSTVALGSRDCSTGPTRRHVVLSRRVGVVLPTSWVISRATEGCARIGLLIGRQSTSVVIYHEFHKLTLHYSPPFCFEDERVQGGYGIHGKWSVLSHSVWLYQASSDT